MNYFLKNKFKFLVSILTICSMAYFTGCSPLNKALDVDSAQNSQGKIQFGYSNGIKIASKGFSTFATSTVTPSAVIVTIESATGNIVKNQVRIEVTKVNNDYISSPISLEVGTYQLTQFMVVDKDSNTLYLAPLKDSEKARLVNKPLPISIVVEKDKTIPVVPDVLPVTSTSNAKAFGYPYFQFNVLNSVQFLMTVFGKNNTCVSANLVIKSDGITLNSQVLNAGTNRVEVKKILDGKNYNLSVARGGYVNYQVTMNTVQLSAYEATPLLISLSPTNTISFFISVKEKNNTYVTANLVIKSDDVTLNTLALAQQINLIEVQRIAQNKYYRFLINANSGHYFPMTISKNISELTENNTTILDVHLIEKPSIYSPSTNIAMNKNRTGYPSPLESDNGWGGGTSKWDLIDGERNYTWWTHGLAFTGGYGYWAGGTPGWRQATIDFGVPKTFNRMITWHFAPQHVPTTYKIQYWDGNNWIDLFSTTTGYDYLMYRDVGEIQTIHSIIWPDGYYGVHPLENTFPAVTAQKIRFTLDNSNLEHGWIYEIEVYND